VLQPFSVQLFITFVDQFISNGQVDNGAIILNTTLLGVLDQPEVTPENFSGKSKIDCSRRLVIIVIIAVVASVFPVFPSTFRRLPQKLRRSSENTASAWSTHLIIMLLPGMAF